MSNPSGKSRLRAYRRTFGDRFGGDLGRAYAVAGYALVGAFVLVLIATRYIPPGWPQLILLPVVFVAGWAGIVSAVLLMITPAAKVAEFYLAPTGASTPYEDQFSQEDALVMQDRVPEALALFEQRIAADPAEIRARVRAADLYAGLGKNPQRAAELFREVQRIPALSSGQDMYAGNRLADLFVGPLGTPTRAIVELRRLLDRYPESRVAPQLRQAIASLKARHVPDDRAAQS